MKGSAAPDRLIGVYAAKLDKQLEDMLDEFDNFDYTCKPLLTQAEFEEEFLIIIEKLFRRKSKYQMIYAIFESLIAKSLNDQHKFLCLIDFVVNISRYDPAVFKNLPNDVLANVVHTPIFAKVQDLIYNVGRMHYHFKKFTKQVPSSQITTTKIDPQGKASQATEISENKLSESSDVGTSDESDKEPGERIMELSLAELTKKIMSKTKIGKQKSSTNRSGSVKTEVTPEHDESILNRSGSEGSDFSDYAGPRAKNDHLSDDEYSSDGGIETSQQKIKKRKTRNSSKSELENLVESDSAEYHTAEETEDEAEDEEDDQKSLSGVLSTRKVRSQKLVVPGGRLTGVSEEIGSDENEKEDEHENLENEDIDITMNSTTSIMEHNMDYIDSGTNNQRVRVPGSRRATLASRISKTNQLIRLTKPRSRPIPNATGYSKRQKTEVSLDRSKTGKKEVKHTKKSSPVRNKSFYVIEKNLDFLYTEIERFKPSYNATLSKEAFKGFSYKPAQFSFFTNLQENVTGVDSEVAGLTDDLLNTFLNQVAKRCGGNEIDESQYVHPFEYDYIMENLDTLMKKSSSLPPMIFHRRFNSFFDEDGNVNGHIKMISMRETKVKGLRRLLVFETEDDYFKLFKKIVPRDRVSSRIDFLNKLVTDGKSIYSFELVDTVQGMMNDPIYAFDSEEEEERLLLQEKASIAEAARSKSTSNGTNQDNSEEVTEQRYSAKETKSDTIDTEKKDFKPEIGVPNLSTENVSKEENQVNAIEAVPDRISMSDVNVHGKINETVTPSESIAETLVTSTELVNVNDHSDESLTLVTSQKSSGNAKECSSDLPPGEQKKEHNVMAKKLDEITEEQIKKVVVETEAVGESQSLTHLQQAVTNSQDSKEQNFPADGMLQQNLGAGNAVNSAKTSEVVSAAKKDKTSTPSLEVLTQTKLEQELRRRDALESKKREKYQRKFGHDDREEIYCSSKGVRVSSRALKKVISTKECFELLAMLLFPKLRVDPTFSGIPLNSLRSIGLAYDSFRPYLLSLFLSDVFEFLRLPRYFKVDAMMFELQMQDLMKTTNPSSKTKTVTFHA